ncbi:MAG: hypothetical protein JO114_20135 [Planctomycetaceae bacterium]|nr:hypothetical protein [Planctomycetaceae bacterium]
MLSKHKVGTLMSGFLTVTRRFGLLAFLLIGLAADAYAQSVEAEAHASDNASFKRFKRGAPEIAVGAGISAFVLAGGGLLLLADRLRGKKKSKS